MLFVHDLSALLQVEDHLFLVARHYAVEMHHVGVVAGLDEGRAPRKACDEVADLEHDLAFGCRGEGARCNVLREVGIVEHGERHDVDAQRVDAREDLGRCARRLSALPSACDAG